MSQVHWIFRKYDRTITPGTSFATMIIIGYWRIDSYLSQVHQGPFMVRHFVEYKSGHS